MNTVCRGSMRLGNGCGVCNKCLQELSETTRYDNQEKQTTVNIALDYEETIMDGVLHWRVNKVTDWTPFTSEQLTNKLIEMKLLLKEPRDTVYEKAPWWANPDIPKPEVTCNWDNYKVYEDEIPCGEVNPEKYKDYK